MTNKQTDVCDNQPGEQTSASRSLHQCSSALIPPWGRILNRFQKIKLFLDMSSIVDTARKGEWSGVDCSSAQCSPQDCCRSAPSPVATWGHPPPRAGSGERKKITFERLKVTAITSSSSISTACYHYWLYVEERFFGGNMCEEYTRLDFAQSSCVYNAIEHDCEGRYKIFSGDKKVNRNDWKEEDDEAL